MLARMIRVIISDNSTTHIRQTDIIVETVGRPRPAKQYTAQTDRERERETEKQRIIKKYSAVLVVMKSRENNDVKRDKTRKFRVNFLISGLIK